MKWLLALLGIPMAHHHAGQSHLMDKLRQVSDDLSATAADGEVRVQDVIYRTATTARLAQIDAEATARRTEARGVANMRALTAGVIDRKPRS